MNPLLRQAQAEVKRLHEIQEKKNGDETLEIYLEWGRGDRKDRRLLTVIKDVPRSILKSIQKRNRRDPRRYTGLD